MDIAYPLMAGASKEGDEELRYSLRSVHKHLSAPDRVFIFGVRPAFLQDVMHVPMDDPGDKARNLIAKYRAMIDSDLSDPFLLLDDDIVFLQDAREHPLYVSGTLGPLVDRIHTAYGTYLKNALDILRANGLPERNYQIHQPMLIHKATLARALDLAGESRCVMGSLYGNIADQPVVEAAHDFRIDKPSQWDECKDGPHISLGEQMQMLAYLRHDGALRLLDLGVILAHRFPRPSPWETA